MPQSTLCLDVMNILNTFSNTNKDRRKCESKTTHPGFYFLTLSSILSLLHFMFGYPDIFSFPLSPSSHFPALAAATPAETRPTRYKEDSLVQSVPAKAAIILSMYFRPVMQPRWREGKGKGDELSNVRKFQREVHGRCMRSRRVAGT